MIGKKIRIVQDSLEGTYEEYIGETATIVDVYDDQELTFYLVFSSEFTRKEIYLDEGERIVLATDVEVENLDEVV